MNNFEERYKKFFKNANLSNNEYETIKSNILNNKKAKIFKLRYVYIIILIIFISFTGVVSASKIINHMKIDVNEDIGTKKITFDTALDKDYDGSLFEKGDYYTYDEIEGKLGFKILKSNYYDSNLFKIIGKDEVDGKIASVSFDMVNSDKSSRYPWLQFLIHIDTKYATEKSYFWVKGDTYLDTYYINALGIEASIIYFGNPCTSAIIHFVYNDVFYELSIDNDNYFQSYDDFVDTSKEKLKNDIIEVLESLSLD